MTAAEIILRVKDQIQHPATLYRHTDTKLLRYMNDAIRAIYAKHPSAAYLTAVTTTEPAALTATSETFPLTSWWVQPTIHFMCWCALVESTEDNEAPGLAASHKQQYDQLVG
jgi:hypothetical protein